MNRLNDRGSASVATAGLVAALLCLVLIVVNVAAAVVHSHQARNAADTAAIAGALAVSTAAAAPCRAAADVASKNNAIVQECRVEGGDVVVEVRLGTARAQARAGPI